MDDRCVVLIERSEGTGIGFGELNDRELVDLTRPGWDGFGIIIDPGGGGDPSRSPCKLHDPRLSVFRARRRC